MPNLNRNGFKKGKHFFGRGIGNDLSLSVCVLHENKYVLKTSVRVTSYTFTTLVCISAVNANDYKSTTAIAAATAQHLFTFYSSFFVSIDASYESLSCFVLT